MMVPLDERIERLLTGSENAQVEQLSIVRGRGCSCIGSHDCIPLNCDI